MADEKRDPLGQEFYAPLVRAEKTADVLFFTAGALSLAALFVTPHDGILFRLVGVAFPLSVMALFIVTHAVRLYFFPRAQRGRLRDFLSHAYGKPLQPKQSVAYYNNSATTPPARILAQTLESVFFTKSILLKMCSWERALVVGYFAIWSIAVLNRTTDLALIGVIAQLVFSEQIVSRYLRVEWLRSKCEALYEQVFNLIQGTGTTGPAPIEFFTWYETVKATAGVSISGRLFEQNRERLNKEWEDIRALCGF